MRPRRGARAACEQGPPSQRRRRRPGSHLWVEGAGPGRRCNCGPASGGAWPRKPRRSAWETERDGQGPQQADRRPVSLWSAQYIKDILVSWNRTESPEIDPHVYSQLIFLKKIIYLFIFGSAGCSVAAESGATLSWSTGSRAHRRQ